MNSQSELLESIDELRVKARAEDKAKLEALERQLGVSSGPIESEGGEAGPSTSTSGSKRLVEVDVAEIAQKRHKFDDSKFLEESREIKENVRSAVMAGKSHSPRNELLSEWKGRAKGPVHWDRLPGMARSCGHSAPRSWTRHRAVSHWIL